jgi:hypothetical protein
MAMSHLQAEACAQCLTLYPTGDPASFGQAACFQYFACKYFVGNILRAKAADRGPTAKMQYFADLDLHK